MRTPLNIATATLLLSAMALATTSKKIDQHFKVEQGQRIEVRGFTGSRIHIKSWDKPEVYISLNISISGSGDKHEKRVLDAMKIEESRSAERLSLTFDDQSAADGNGSWWNALKSLVGLRQTVSRNVTGDIYVPSSIELTASIPYADVTLENMKGVVNFKGSSNGLELTNCALLNNISNDYGKTIIRNSGGTLLLRGQSGTIVIEDFDGGIDCNVPYATVQLARITKSVSIASQSGGISVDDVKGNLTVRSDFSVITVSNITGFADITSQSGTIKVRQVGGAKVDADYSEIEITKVDGTSNKDIVVNSQSGSVTLENITGNIRIDNPYSRMRLSNVKGNVKLTTESGSIDAEDIAGEWDSETQYSAVRVRGLSAKTVRAANSGDEISLELTTVPTRVEISNQYANVSITMPKGFGGDVSLDAEYGSITTDFSLTTKNRGGSGYAFGRVGSGNGSIKIETTSGKIYLNEK